MVLHESQSLLMEMQVARGDAFLGFLAPMVARALGADPAFRPDNLARLTRRVARGLIRVDSDEIAYPLHVMLRYRLERAMLSGDLAVGDLPGAWNDGMREMLGVVPPDDCDGCMQDVHWFSGAFGYFPTYTLGALAAAQLFAAARRAVAGLPEALARGDVAPLLHWLREQVHGRASLMSTDAVLQAATGAPLETAAYLAHVEARYLS
jgi:carboxypeptidase Taq